MKRGRRRGRVPGIPGHQHLKMRKRQAWPKRPRLPFALPEQSVRNCGLLVAVCRALDFFTATLDVAAKAGHGVASCQTNGNDQDAQYGDDFFHDLFPFRLTGKTDFLDAAMIMPVCKTDMLLCNTGCQHLVPPRWMLRTSMKPGTCAGCDCADCSPAHTRLPILRVGSTGLRSKDCSRSNDCS